MTDLALPASRFDPRDFRIGAALSRTFSVLAHNFPAFFLINLVAVLPDLLFENGPVGLALGLRQKPAIVTAVSLLTFLLGMICQAAVLHGAFQDMLGRPVRLLESVQVGLRRFLPVLGASITSFVLIVLAAVLFLVPGLIVYVMLFVTIPACVVERLGPFDSISRSSQLTKGHGWAIFAMVLLLWIASAIVSAVISGVATTFAGPIVAAVADAVWSVVETACSAILAVVTYRDLRVAKEGIDTEQIAAVFA
jgi:hypothetical protein